ncbi:hypothetical protein TRVL_10274 [Trypanosoma vivax]|nr:hypothetical protein TRVL_10274 [Trypanosoma vivax]
MLLQKLLATRKRKLHAKLIERFVCEQKVQLTRNLHKAEGFPREEPPPTLYYAHIIAYLHTMRCRCLRYSVGRKAELDLTVRPDFLYLNSLSIPSKTLSGAGG